MKFTNKSKAKALRLYAQKKINFWQYKELVGDLIVGHRRNHMRPGEALTTWSFQP